MDLFDNQFLSAVSVLVVVFHGSHYEEKLSFIVSFFRASILASTKFHAEDPRTNIKCKKKKKILQVEFEASAGVE
jgi:hypothetical protein